MTQLSPDSRIWIYQSSRAFSPTEVAKVKAAATQFVAQWTAHNHALLAKADVLHNRFVVLAVDESQAGASGCSIDKSVHFMQQLGGELGVDFFNRLDFAYRAADGSLQTAHKDDFATLYKNGAITTETPVFNNLIQTLGDLPHKWEIPLGQSWHKNFV